MLAFLNSTLIALILEALGNKTLGQGVLDFFMADFLALRIPIVQVRDLETAYNEIRRRPIQDVWHEYGVEKGAGKNPVLDLLADRKNLDDVVFDALDLTKGEREAVYEAVIDLVESRLKKAGSLNH